MVRASISLGPFQLVRALATGGMGVVWEAVHRRQAVPVAIKVLHPDTPGADLGSFREAIENEVRAAAGLDHPNSITVFDYGTIPPEVAELSAGELEADSPWFAMELVEGGTLLSQLGRLPWEDGSGFTPASFLRIPGPILRTASPIVAIAALLGMVRTALTGSAISSAVRGGARQPTAAATWPGTASRT